MLITSKICRYFIIEKGSLPIIVTVPILLMLIRKYNIEKYTIGHSKKPGIPYSPLIKFKVAWFLKVAMVSHDKAFGPSPKGTSSIRNCVNKGCQESQMVFATSLLPLNTLHSKNVHTDGKDSIVAF